MSRYIIFESFLKPLATGLMKEAMDRIPNLTDYDPEFDFKDPRPAALLRYDSESEHISEKSLVLEARTLISDTLDSSWDRMKQINEAMGDQTKETRTETKEIL